MTSSKNPTCFSRGSVKIIKVQFKMDLPTKDRLKKFIALNNDDILKHLKKEVNQITYDDAINYLLDKHGVR